MQNARRITAPFSAEEAAALRAGERVLISGVIIAARDMAHKKLVETLDAGLPLPVDLKGALLYYVAPSPAKPGAPIGSAGPSTSERLDSRTPRLLELGLHGMMGKGVRGPDVMEAIKKYRVPYLTTLGGAGALLAQCVKKYTVLAYEELGPEAIAALEVEDFPAIVAIDAEGNNYYDEGQKPYRRLQEYF